MGDDRPIADTPTFTSVRLHLLVAVLTHYSLETGALEGNRTLVCVLPIHCSTIELREREVVLPARIELATGHYQ
jgi:hypothetical protein